MGLSLMGALDDALPFDLDIDADTDISGSALTGVIGWLYLHRLPFLVWLVLFLTSFGIAGIFINAIIVLPTLFSLPLALIITVFSCRFLGKRIAKIMPKNESSAVSSDSFAGKVATITIGNARKGSPAEAVLRDDFQQKHYVLVEPEEVEQVFAQGSQVLLIEKLSKSWLAVPFKPL